MFIQSSFRTLPLRSFHKLISPTTLLLSKHTPRLYSFPIANAIRELHAPRSNATQAKCFSTSSVVDTVEWKEMDVVAEVKELMRGPRRVVQSVANDSISVRDFFMGTSVDVKSLGKKYRRNRVSYPYECDQPPDVVLRFGNTKPHMKIGLGAISGSDISYMAVFNYGSVILLNVRDSEINERLEIVKMHASDVDLSSEWLPGKPDLLPEDGPVKLKVYASLGDDYDWCINLGLKSGGEKGLCLFGL